jgi:phytoene synthase
MTTLSPQLRADLDICRALHRRHGKSYYFATRFFPSDQRRATYALYAFFRVPDDLVDETYKHDAVKAQEALTNWRDEWRKAYEGFPSTEPVLRATAWVFHHFKIPYEYSEAFLEAMLQDTAKARYDNYEELQSYMYGSAVVVGLMMTHVIGFSDEKALPHAKELGEAMQLTNFLRDIREDLEERDRIYLPLQELAAFGLTEEDLKNHTCDDRFTSFLMFQIQRCDDLYARSAAGIPLLNPSGRTAVAIASRLYQEILRKIEKQRYNVFLGRARTSGWEKALLSFEVWKNL